MQAVPRDALSSLNDAHSHCPCLVRLQAQLETEKELWRRADERWKQAEAQLAARDDVIEAARGLRECALKQHGDCFHTMNVADALARLNVAEVPSQEARQQAAEVNDG